MRMVFFAKGQRGFSCLKAVLEHRYEVKLVILQPDSGHLWDEEILSLSKKNNLGTLLPTDPNSEEIEKLLMEIEPDLLILAGYGKIIKEKILRLARIMCLNLHAGKLPKYRGSSPMNWALINGETSFTLSIIKVNKGIDTGDLLQEKTFPISLKDTIKTLHDLAAEEFPLLLLKTLSGIRNGTLAPSRQIREEASYYPLRFPEDGLILWDRLTAMEIHNRIRALAPPYPSAFTFYRGRKVKLVSSELHDFDFFGEPGRIYRITKRGFLICARDKCLWIREALFSESRESLHEIVHPYDKLLTLSGFVLDQMGAGHDY